MKKNIDNLESTYKLCSVTGKFKEKLPDTELAKSVKNVSEKGLEFIKDKMRYIRKDSAEWTFVFRDYYESLRGMIEAYLLLDGIGADNHQCNNAYICFRHPELELDWDFLESIRLRRNMINYRGQMLNYDDWKMFELKFELHINAIKNEIEKRIKSGK